MALEATWKYVDSWKDERLSVCLDVISADTL